MNGTCECEKGYHGADCKSQTLSEDTQISYEILASSLFSVAVCLWVLVYHKETLPRLLVYRTLCDMGFTAHFVLLEIIFLVQMSISPPDHDFQPLFCSGFAFFAHFFGFASLMWYFITSIDYYEYVCNPFVNPGRKDAAYHIFVWGSATVSALYVYRFSGYRPGLHMCWTSMSSSTNGKYMDVLLLQIPICICVITSIIVLVICHVKQSDGEYQTLLARRTLLRSQRVTVYVFTIFWLMVAGLLTNLYEVSYGFVAKLDEVDDILDPSFWSATPWQLRHVFTTIFPLFPSLNVFVWWWTYKRNAKKLRSTWNFDSFQRHLRPLEQDTIPSLLRMEFVRLTTKGIKKLLESPVPDLQSDILNLNSTYTNKPSSKVQWIHRGVRSYVFRQNRAGWFGRFFRCLAKGSEREMAIVEYGPMEFNDMRKAVYGLTKEAYLHSLLQGVIFSLPYLLSFV